jgi:hypothetical protein
MFIKKQIGILINKNQIKPGFFYPSSKKGKKCKKTIQIFPKRFGKNSKKMHG